MSYTVRPAFMQCLHRLEEKQGNRLSWAHIGRQMGMTRQAAQALFTGDSSDDSFAKYGTIAKLLDFFAAEGMPVTVADLFTVTPVTPDTDA